MSNLDLENIFSLQNKRILVTGASSGIGRAVAIQCAKQGAKLILVARNEVKLKETLISLMGEDHVISCFDFSTKDVFDWLDNLLTKLGPLDGVVHCAGVHSSTPLKFVNYEDTAQLLNTNINSTIQLIKALRKPKNHNSNCSVVLVSSASALIGENAISEYSASKGALISLGRSLATELSRDKIRVNTIAPGIVKTEMTQKMFSLFSNEQIENLEKKHPLGFGSVIDIANPCVFLLSEASKWMSGSVITIDGGYSATK